MLKESWGQSKILELALADYINAQRTGWESLDGSPAPLRNLLKDMKCIEQEFNTNTNNDTNATPFPPLPTINSASNAISTACNNDNNLSNSAFVSLVDIMMKREYRRRFE